jgi:hypothetical protein
MNKEQTIAATIIGFSLYLIAAGITFAVTKIVSPGSVLYTNQLPNINGNVPKPANGFTNVTVDPSQPKTAECPLNGVMYTDAEKGVWSKERPLAVMIENHSEARPQSGLSRADVVYEAVAEGGVTRFMGVFYCGIAAEGTLLAPVRSARTYFLPWVLEYDALYNHVGGAGNCNDTTVDERAKALCQIREYGIKDMDQFGISFPICYRNYDRLDHTVATEHTMVCDSNKLMKLASERGWTDVDAKGVSWDKNFVPWTFKDDAKKETRGTTTSISFVQWKGYEKEYGVTWNFDTATNTYKRSNGGAPHIDLETKEQLTAKSIVILFADETDSVDEHLHLLFDNIGTGTGIAFQDGKAENVTWKKATKGARTKFFDSTGKEIAFNRGQIWIEMVATGTKITY